MAPRIYTGPCDGVELLLDDGHTLQCVNGQTVEIPDELADRLDPADWTTPPDDPAAGRPARRRERAAQTTPNDDPADTSGTGEENE